MAYKIIDLPAVGRNMIGTDLFELSLAGGTGSRKITGAEISAGFVSSVTATSPILSSGGTTPIISIPQATISASGYLSALDFITFNNKQNALTFGNLTETVSSVLTITGGTGATAGQAAAKLYSLTVAGDAVQTTAASQPLLLAHNGSDNYWWGSGVAGNSVSTPNAAAQTLVNGFEFKGFINTRNLATYGVLANKQSGNGYQFYLRSTGVLGIYAPGIATSIESTVGLTLNTDIYFKINRAAGSSNFIFYSSTDGISYTQLGATVVVNSNNFTTSTQPFIVGGDGASGGFLGRIYRLTLSNSIGGTPVVDFNPASYNASTSQTAWTSATGEVWTINTGTATTGYKGVLVDRTIVQGDGVDDKLGGISVDSIPSNLSIYASFRKFLGASDGDLFGASISGDSFMHFFCENNNIKRWSSGPTYSIVNTLNLMSYTGTGVSVGSVETMQKNNGTASTVNNAKIIKPTGLNLGLFAISSIGSFNLNSILNTFFIANSVDNTTTRTATYNLIRSLNNNAF
jgi:hypothetical protein